MNNSTKYAIALKKDGEDFIFRYRFAVTLQKEWRSGSIILKLNDCYYNTTNEYRFTKDATLKNVFTHNSKEKAEEFVARLFKQTYERIDDGCKFWLSKYPNDALKILGGEKRENLRKKIEDLESRIVVKEISVTPYVFGMRENKEMKMNVTGGQNYTCFVCGLTLKMVPHIHISGATRMCIFCMDEMKKLAQPFKDQVTDEERASYKRCKMMKKLQVA